MKPGTLYIDWTHSDGCPAECISILSEPAKWRDRHRICECGMPSDWEMDAMHENESTAWAARVEGHETDRHEDPGAKPHPDEPAS